MTTATTVARTSVRRRRTDLTSSLEVSVAASRAAQGLSPTVTDPDTLCLLGRLLADHRGRTRPARPTTARFVDPAARTA
jgi:hypothetical protein